MTDEPAVAIDFENMVRADDAVSWLARRVGGQLAAKAELADRMRDGTLEAFAKRVWDAREADVAAAWRAGPDENDDFTELRHDISLEPFWLRSSLDWPLDLSEWRWPSGRFTTIVGDDPFQRVMIEHVHFRQSDLTALDSEFLLDSAPPRIVNNNSSGSAPIDETTQSWTDEMVGTSGKFHRGRGRPAKVRGWGPIIEAIIRLRETGGINQQNFRLQDDFVNHLRSISNEAGDGLGASSIKPIVEYLSRVGLINGW